MGWHPAKYACVHTDIGPVALVICHADRNTESMESMQGKMDKAMQKLDQVEVRSAVL